LCQQPAAGLSACARSGHPRGKGGRSGLFQSRSGTDSHAAAEKQISVILKTINAPHPTPIDTEIFVHCLTTDHPDRKWQPHIEAFFDEVPVEAIHDFVLASVVSFEDLYRAARNWRATNGSSFDWIKEMADVRLRKPDA
jgi:hypothetical protein